MPRRDRCSGWLVSGLCLLFACVEPAHSADVPPELAPRVATSAAASVVVGMEPAQAKSSPAPASAKIARSDAAPSEPAGTVEVEQPAQPSGSFEVDGFFGGSDGPVREALVREAPMRIERGRGGRSLGFKMTLESGRQGYFKGEQLFSAANWYGEVASYHLDRMLGLGRVPTVVSRQFPWSRLAPAAGGDPRKAEIIVRNGQVRGAFVAWVDGNLRPLVQEEGWERWVRVKYWPTTMVSPFQRPAVWKRQLDQLRRNGLDSVTKEERVRRRGLKPEPDREDRPAELSDLIVFDYLTRNIDRWGGGNANVLTRGDKGALIFLDNGASFEPGEARPSLMEARLHALQRFRRRTIQAARSFDLKKLEARLAKEPIQPVLNRAQLDALEERRKALLEWVAQMETEHGEAIWAWE